MREELWRSGSRLFSGIPHIDPLHVIQSQTGRPAVLRVPIPAAAIDIDDIISMLKSPAGRLFAACGQICGQRGTAQRGSPGSVLSLPLLAAYLAICRGIIHRNHGWVQLRWQLQTSELLKAVELLFRHKTLVAAPSVYWSICSSR